MSGTKKREKASPRTKKLEEGVIPADIGQPTVLLEHQTENGNNGQKDLFPKPGKSKGSRKQPVPPPEPREARLNEEMQQLLGEFQLVREELNAVRQASEDAGRELLEIKQQTQTARQELQQTVGDLRELNQAVVNEELIRQMVEDLHRVETQSEAAQRQLLTGRASYAHELTESQNQLEELQEHSRTTRANFLALFQELQGLDQQVRDAQGEMGRVRLALDEVAMDVQTARAEAKNRVDDQVIEQHFPGEDKEEKNDQGHPLKPGVGITKEPSPERQMHLGVIINPEGVVLEVLADTPAEVAGIQKGDVVIEVAGKPIANSEELRTAVEQVEAGGEVTLLVTRGQINLEVKAHLPASSEP
jgi:predicted  nucleic acid-binding Zn-ribbon protein